MKVKNDNVRLKITLNIHCAYYFRVYIYGTLLGYIIHILVVKSVKPTSPRARYILFIFLSPYVYIEEISQKSKYAILTNTDVRVFSEICFEHKYPPKKKSSHAIAIFCIIVHQV